MENLEYHTLLNDQDGPMCNLYTSEFIKSKMLNSSGRKPFPQLTFAEQNDVDPERTKNEIALIDNLSKKVFYGIESLLKVIGNSFSWIEKIGNFRPIHFLQRKLYKFISYNRKVITPSTVKATNSFHCVPDFNIKYRTSFIAFATLCTSAVLFQYLKMILFLPKATFVRALLLATGKIGFQCMFIQKFNKQQQFNYGENLVVLSILGSLLLLPILVLNRFIILNPYLILGWFALTVNVMLLEHCRRIRFLKMFKFLTIT